MLKCYTVLEVKPGQCDMKGESSKKLPNFMFTLESSQVACMEPHSDLSCKVFMDSSHQTSSSWLGIITVTIIAQRFRQALTFEVPLETPSHQSQKPVIKVLNRHQSKVMEYQLLQSSSLY